MALERNGGLDAVGKRVRGASSSENERVGWDEAVTEDVREDEAGAKYPTS